MTASKTGLPAHTGNGETVYAAQITKIEQYLWDPEIPNLGMVGRLFFDSEGKRSNLIPRWMEQHHPEVGGYFVVHDGREPEYLSAEDFSQEYTKVENNG